MPRQTSINCYHSSIKGKVENTQFKKIFNCVLELEEATRGEIADRLKMEKAQYQQELIKCFSLVFYKR